MSGSRRVIIGSRGSDLALWQANTVKNQLSGIGIESEIKIISTQGDRIQHLSLDKLEGKGFFTREIEEELLAGKIDLAVHSHKDLPTISPPGLCIAAVSMREDPSDLLLIREEKFDPNKLHGLPKSAVVGTSSFRRKLLLKAWRDDLVIQDLRGNVPTRINKLREGQYDAILIAWAGVKRLNLDLSGLKSIRLSQREFVPAPAQGVLALQTREQDVELIKLLQPLHHQEVQDCINLERKVLNMMEGGCHTPLGILCRPDTDEDDQSVYHIHLAWASTDASPPVFLNFKASSLVGWPERITHALRHLTPSRVFISRENKPFGFFHRTLSKLGFQVMGHSLIEMLPLSNPAVKDTDWIFFSSKHAVDFFLKTGASLKGKKIGAISKATADRIRKAGYVCDFIGYSTDTAMTGKQFASVAGSSTVLFPVAKGSLRTVQKQLNSARVFDAVVYETIDRSAEIPDFDIPVFTSPSNVDAFFKVRANGSVSRGVAMGSATASRMKHFGIKSIEQPDAFDDLGLVSAVIRLSIKQA
jgi:hydroxymethylbilane synthase